jgi:Ca-activated chloride channel family protein
MDVALSASYLFYKFWEQKGYPGCLKRCKKEVAMKKILLILGVLSAAVLLNTYGQEEKAKEGTLSPYFFVQSNDPNLDPLPLLETKVKANIAGIIAQVELTQVYKNEGKRTIEAIYVFPLGVKAAIHKMTMKIGERVIEAKIEERQQAKATYEAAKKQGKVASLLEQERPNVFQMKVANIMPKDVIEVSVHYTELLVPEEGVYEFVYPTVVGPRYGGEVTAPQETDAWVENPYLHEGEEPSYNFDIAVKINAAVSLNKLWVPSHKADIKYNSASEAVVTLSPQEKKGGNRDFIMRYMLAAEAIQGGLLLYPSSEEKFFLLMAQPPQKIVTKDIPAREYIFIVDVSGSMHGFPLDISKALITKMIEGLREKDYFNILFFSGSSAAFSQQPQAATEENKQRAIAMLNNQQGGGGTEILAALQKVLSLGKKEGVCRSIVIATDGYVAVEKEVFDLIRQRLSQANVFAFGIGTSVNRYLIEGIAHAGEGESFVVANPGEARRIAEKFSKYISSPLLTDIKVAFEGFEAYDVEPLAIPDLFAQRPLIVYGKYKSCSGEIKITGKTSQGDYLKEIKVAPALEDKGNIALKYLWAREKISRLADYSKVGKDVKDEVTHLGLKYALMTEYTSFVAVDTVVRDTGETVTVKQPLPLPQGVSDYAVGGHNILLGINPLYSGASYSLDANRKCSANYSSYYVGGGSREFAEGEKSDKKYELSEVYITEGKFPKGLSMDAFDGFLSPLKKTLGKLFKEAGLGKAQLILEVKKGRVISIAVKNYQGKMCDIKSLENILGKLNLPASLSGTIEIQLAYI